MDGVGVFGFQPGLGRVPLSAVSRTNFLIDPSDEQIAAGLVELLTERGACCFFCGRSNESSAEARAI